MRYFAYGSNMSPHEMARVGCDAQTVGTAMLSDYRLAFTRRSKKTGTGVADIVPARGLAVWGVLYEVGEECLSKLDIKEGLGHAYRRVEVKVRLADGSTCQALTYSVIEKEETEIAPREGYLAKLIEGARHHALEDYLGFLESLASEDIKSFRRGFLVLPSRLRTRARGMPLVRVSETLRTLFRERDFCVIKHRDRTAAARLAFDPGIQQGSCELDQNIRIALGIRGRKPFGAFVQLIPSGKRISGFPAVAPRTLILPIHRPFVLDSEKQICVLNQRIIRMLGIEEGDYIKIRVATLGPDGRAVIRGISRRVFSGSARTIQRGARRLEGYPLPEEVYVDFDGRMALGLDRDVVGIPALISPDVRRLFARRIMYYGATLFLGTLAISPLIQQVASSWGFSSIVGMVASLLCAMIVTVLLTTVDLRGRIQY